MEHSREERILGVIKKAVVAKRMIIDFSEMYFKGEINTYLSMYV